MSLDTFANLKTSIAAWFNRSGDTDLTTYIPDMITMAEAEMNRRINTRRKFVRADATLSAEFVDLPSDFDAAIGLVLTSTDPDTTLTYIDPSEAMRLKSLLYNAAGVPVHYSIVGDEFQIIPEPDTSYTAELTYRQKIPALSDSATSNWVLTSHPDIYLYGSLIHAAPFLKDDPRVAVWSALHERALSSLERQDSISNFGGRLNMRPTRAFG